MCLGSSSPTNWGKEATDVDSLFVAGGEGWMEKERERERERRREGENLPWSGERGEYGLYRCSDALPGRRRLPNRPRLPKISSEAR